ncbi:MAG: DUF421 domain-containing protein [Halanaerobiaceae bacterium]
MIIVIARTFILYTTVIIVIRLMGKRQIGELQPFELAITIMISALAAIPIEDIGIPLVYSFIPILLLLGFQEILSYLSLKSTKARSIICGTPSVVIRNGKLIQEELSSLRININDLIELLRIKGYHTLEDVEYAIMETTGELSVIPKSQKRPVTPEDLEIDTQYEGLPRSLIIDGEILQQNLTDLNLDKNWLKKTLNQYNIESPEQILFAAINTKGDLIYQEKKEKRNNK